MRVRRSGKLAENTTDQGVSLLELLVATAVIAVVSGMAIFITTNVYPVLRADSALQLELAQLRKTRQASMDQRRPFVATFNGTGGLLVKRAEINLTTGAITGYTTVADYLLPNGVTYMVFPLLPDTPDRFGNSSAVSFNGGNTITFQGDGTALDAAGNYVNGTVFMGIAGNPQTARAITILGATGRIRSYRYNGTIFH